MKPTIARMLLKALAHQTAGRLDQAERIGGSVLERDPGNADGWHLLGRVALERGDLLSAAARVMQAIRQKPASPAFACSLGDILAAQGRTADAILCYRKTLQLEENYVPALVNLGNALQSQGHYEDACVSYGRAIRRQPGCAAAVGNLGNALRALGRLDEALECCREAWQTQPESAETAANLSAVLTQMERPVEAEEWARRALWLRPGLVAALSNLSLALTAQKRFEEAEPLAREALAGNPLDADLHSSLGAVLLHRRRPAEAETALRRSLELSPGQRESGTLLALALCDQDRLAEAAGQCEQVLRLHPQYAPARVAMGTARRAEGRNVEALACFEEAVTLDPQHPKARFNRSLSLLMAGRFGEGFAEYEWRWRIMAEKPRACSLPAWDGSPLGGKTILLSAEQGLGDAIQFARYVPLVAARGGRIIVETSERIASLIASVDGVREVITPDVPLPSFEEQAALMSLPHILGTEVETIPASIPYLRADAQLEQRLRGQLGAPRSLRVGLAWAGNPENPDDRRRSLALERLAPLGKIEGVEYYSLHADPAARSAVRSSGNWVREVLTDSGGIPELAALMCCLDLVISADTMAAHLAGALGRPVWTLLSFAPDWRWHLNAEESPWYPTMRLFRQPRRGDWDSVVFRVCESIRSGRIQCSDKAADKQQ